MKETNKSLLSGLAVIIGLVIIVALAGLVAISMSTKATS